MDLRLSDEDEAFRAEADRFFRDDYPQDVLEKMRRGQILTREDHVASQRALQSRGWLGVGWPPQFGGPDWSQSRRYVFETALESVGAPSLIPMAIIYVGPIICAFGTDAQQRRWLPDILESRALWAQGYSEPESGSDLASLRFQAVRDGDHYVLNGSKIWTSGAHWADWIFCLARTSDEARKQDGISMICADMGSIGISVHPIITMDGSHELNRVDFENVHVPVSNRIGEEGQGWRYANVLLKAERLSYAHVGRKRADLAHIRRLAAATPSDQSPRLLDDPALSRRLAEVEIEVDILEIAVLRVTTGDADSATVSALKILCTECAQHVTELYVELAGRNALPLLDRQTADWSGASSLTPEFASLAIQSYLFERAQTIYGGATEVQKTIVWRQLAARQS